ncbi:MAG: cyclic nucleotide-binding domain-containing protein [Ramlibacter sp.]|nr:cyclic nucleotide-binding domain-containing protein [Ramlibacter sp.]
MNIQQLVDAIATLDANDALTCKLTLEEWKKLAPYLSIRFLKPGDALMHEGDTDRELFILADGELLVTLGGSVLARLTPGNVVGEGSFFSGQPRSATVSASQPGVAWALSWDRFESLSHKQPKLAVDLVKGLAAVLAIRMREAILVGHFA